jgi:hypothetical protein
MRGQAGPSLARLWLRIGALRRCSRAGLPARQTYPRGLRNDCGMTVICTLEPLWSALQGVGAIGVAVIAALGLVAAFRQINEVRASRTEAANIARTQRTTELLAEFGTDDMEYSFGLFDAAYGVADSREIFNAIYDDFVVSTRRRLRGMERTERLAAVYSPTSVAARESIVAISARPPGVGMTRTRSSRSDFRAAYVPLEVFRSPALAWRSTVAGLMPCSREACRSDTFSVRMADSTCAAFLSVS